MPYFGNITGEEVNGRHCKEMLRHEIAMPWRGRLIADISWEDVITYFGNIAGARHQWQISLGEMLITDIAGGGIMGRR